MTATPAIIVKVLVHHGNYREEFYGAGETIFLAAAEASAKSSYSAGLFDPTDSYAEVRGKYRDELVEKLSSGEEYRGFGWCTYSRIA